MQEDHRVHEGEQQVHPDNIVEIGSMTRRDAGRDKLEVCAGLDAAGLAHEAILLPAHESPDIRTMQRDDRERGGSAERDDRPWITEEPRRDRQVVARDHHY